MPGDLALVFANGVGVVGVVLVVGYLVWSGRFIPKSTHDAHVKMLTDRIDDEQHEKGEWRAESRIKDQQIQELNDQNQMLEAFGRTLVDFLQGLRRAGIGAPEGGDDK